MKIYDIGIELLGAIRSHAGKMAFVTSFGNLTYHQFDNLIGGVALDLKEAGAKRGSVVAIDTQDARIATAAVIACCLIGARWMYGNNVAYHKPGLGITQVFWAGVSIENAPKHPKLVAFNPEKFKARDLSYWLDKVEPEGYEFETDICRIGQSSATTGDAKFIAISLRDMWHRTSWESAASKTVDETVTSCLFPPLSGIGCNTRLRSLFSGGKVVEVGLGKIFESWRQAGVNNVVGSPAQFAAILREAGPEVTPRITAASVGGGRPSQHFLQSMFKCFQNVAVFYGSTEMGNVAETLVKDPATFSGGLLLNNTNMAVEIVDEDGNALPNGTEGKIRIRGKLGTPTYINERPSRTMSIQGEWFYPGDFGHIDHDDCLHISGRLNEILNIGGVKFNALTLDDHVQGFSGVKDGYCYSRLNDLGAEEVEVIISASPDRKAEDVATNLMTHLRATVSKSVLPVRIFTVAEVPRTETGKPIRLKASELAAGLEPAAHRSA
jgi:acyl-coenzyme A synthetase/AMP-(fatty) acid ligase